MYMSTEDLTVSTNRYLERQRVYMAGVAQVVRALGCGPRGRGFESRHSPHFSYLFLFVFFALVACEKKEETNAAPAAVTVAKDFSNIKIPPSVADKIIIESPRQAAHKIPHMTIIVDEFMMREDISNELLNKLSANVILCMPSHCVLCNHLLEQAQSFGYTLAISIDYLNTDQWVILQKVIEQYSWVKGVVIWTVDPKLNTSKLLATVEQWLSYRGIWTVYANTNNFLPIKDLPTKVVIPDGFVKLTDNAERIKEQLIFVLEQAKFSNHGVLLVQPGVQHVAPLVEWCQENAQNMQLKNRL